MSEQYRTAMLAQDSSLGVDREKGVIYGVAILQLGDINGIDSRKQFVDRKTLDQYVSLASAASNGMRARFTHGGPDGEGLGSYLGRWKNPRIDGDKVRQDLQLSPRSHESLRGDIGKYTLDMSESDPDMLGASMIVTLDKQAMNKERRADGWMPLRLKAIHGADIVDTPALVSGMFAAGQSKGAETMSEEITGGITQEQFDAGLKTALETFGQSLAAQILTKVDEKFAANKAEGDDEEPTPEQLRAEGAKRAAQIMSFAAMSGVKDHEKLAQEAIEKDFSVEAFKASLAERLIAGNGLTRDTGEENDDPHAKFRAEFKAGREEFARLGVVDEELYVRSRCRDEGLPVPEIKKAG